MTRKEGFIEVDKMLQEIDVDTKDLDDIFDNPSINEIEYIYDSRIHFSFPYHNEIYYFKRDIYPNCSPYNELVVEELAKDFGIPCVEYDLAILGNYQGIISKNFKLENVNYISGSDLFTNTWKKAHISCSNNLSDIYRALDYRYQNHSNKNEIISYLMRKIVNIYLFDIITTQCDRHSKNWNIMESNDRIDIAPIFDNERILLDNEDNISICLGISFTGRDEENLWESIKQFQKVNSEEFTNIIKEKLWIISEENLKKVFERIENKTGYPMPEERRIYYVSRYQKHKRKLEEILDLTEEREEHNERKNR